MLGSGEDVGFCFFVFLQSHFLCLTPSNQKSRSQAIVFLHADDSRTKSGKAGKRKQRGDRKRDEVLNMHRYNLSSPSLPSAQKFHKTFFALSCFVMRLTASFSNFIFLPRKCKTAAGNHQWTGTSLLEAGFFLAGFYFLFCWKIT